MMHQDHYIISSTALDRDKQKNHFRPAKFEN